jgi:uncharacterized protein (TIGR03083 family)
MARASSPNLLDAFHEAFELALRIIGADPIAQAWTEASAVEGFTVGALVSHLYSALRLFEVALDKPEAPSSQVGGISTFYGLNRVTERAELEDDFHVAVREDAHRRAAEGPAALAANLAKLADRLRARLSGVAMTRLVPVWRIPGAATPLSAYLRTRMVELVVHADDLAASVGIDLDLPEAAADVVFGVFLELARGRCGDVAVLRAFARRERSDAEVLRVL